MGAVGKLAAFGVLMFAGGALWKLCEDSFNAYMLKYVFNTADSTWLVSNMLWHAWPFVLMIIGILCLVTSGLMSRGSRSVSYE